MSEPIDGVIDLLFGLPITIRERFIRRACELFVPESANLSDMDNLAWMHVWSRRPDARLKASTAIAMVGLIEHEFAVVDRELDPKNWLGARLGLPPKPYPAQPLGALAVKHRAEALARFQSRRRDGDLSAEFLETAVFAEREDDGE